MYKHILIPTDGSELSKKAVDHGIRLAKALNAKVTAVSVSEPFHIFAVEPGMLTDTPAEYEKRIAALTGKYLKARHNYDRHDLHYSLKRDGEKIAVRQGGNPSVVRIIFLQLQTNAKVCRQ